jgi:heme exporter protein A
LARAAVVTVSTRVSRGEAEDESGPALAQLCSAAGLDVVSEVVSDDRDAIATALKRLADQENCRFIFTTGGTGMTSDDVTPEATRDVIDREAPGFAETIRAESRNHTPLGILTRGTSGIRGRTLIVNFPGSPRAVRQSWPVVEPTLKHAAEPSNAVEVDGLTRRYGDRVALDRVSFSVPEGSTLAVFGPNGAGKTTLLKVLATLLRPHEGQVQALGCDLPSEAWKLRGHVGYLGHEPALYRSLTARENLRFAAQLHGVENGRVDELLDAVGLARRADDPVQEFSRGMRQRIAAARSVLHRPRLLLLDEPWSAVDPRAIALLEPLIGRASGVTRILVTHDVERGRAEADQILAIRNGRTVRPEEAFA